LTFLYGDAVFMRASSVQFFAFAIDYVRFGPLSDTVGLGSIF